MEELMKDRIRGCLVGLAVGDALGMPVETMSPSAIRLATNGHGVNGYLAPIQRRIEDTRGLPPGSWTDDTQLTLAVARSLVRANGFDLRDQADELVSEWRRTTFGWGGTTAHSARELDERRRLPDDPAPMPIKPGDGCGNGVAMRISPLAVWCYAVRDLTETEPFLTWTMRLGLMTHGDPRASLAAIAIGTAVGAALHLPERRVPAENVRFAVYRLVDRFVRLAEERWANYRPSSELLSERLRVAERHLADPLLLRRAVGTGCFALQSVPFAIGTFLRRPYSFRAAVLEAVNAGGDADTTASMVGAMCGATVGLGGIPENLVAGLHDANRILKAADELIEAIG
jgi:ADP-ribosylglycohydrolase